MIEFLRHSDCKLCSLWQSASHPGLPTRALYDGQSITKKRAVLFLGQSPGHQEDKSTSANPDGKAFVGYTGQLITRMAEASKLTDFVDIYLSNSCRCKPPQGADEKQTHLRACRSYFIEDIRVLNQYYEEVIVVALGAKACYSALKRSSLSEAIKKQGMVSPVFDGTDIRPPRVFCTYHPAILHPSREPALVTAVQSHFQLLLRYLVEGDIPNEIRFQPEVGIDVPDLPIKEATLDIETYGILSGWEQTVFHPIKSKVVDGVDFKNQVVTVSFAWEDDTGKVRTALYIYKWEAHRKKIVQWLEKISHEKVTLCGQNIKYDLLYLYMSGDMAIKYWIDPRRLIIDDTLIWSFLLFEQQPEKGLKELCRLHGICDYDTFSITGKSGNAKSPRDKELHIYNCADSGNTHVLKSLLRRMILEKYGIDTPKIGPVCDWIRNVILWDTFMLEANGSAFSLDKLQKYNDTEEQRCKELFASAEAEYGIKLAGPGSDKPLRQLMLDCLVEAGMMEDSRVKWTEKDHGISIGVENVNLVKKHIPEGRNKKIISSFQEYKERSKIVSTYTGPLLGDARKGIVTRRGRIGIVYPSWYPVPAYAERGGSSDDSAGGQIQGRISCKKPARQTEPKTIRQSSCSRWPGGTLVECDMAQDHLRMAALLSGDPELLEVYHTPGASLHLKTAKQLFPECDIKKFKDEHPKEYVMCKSLNFAVIFRCGPETFQKTALEDAALELTTEYCAAAIQAWSNLYHVYWNWQDRMIALAAQQGYLILPTGWSRSFGLGQKNIAGQASEVLNFLHQTPCAQLTHSAQYKIQHEFFKYHLRSLACINIYDALFVDCYPGEEANTKEILHYNMNHPPLLPVFERWVGRTIPWAADLKQYLLCPKCGFFVSRELKTPTQVVPEGMWCDKCKKRYPNG